MKRPNLRLIGVPESDVEHGTKLENTLQDTGRVNPELIQTYDPLQLPPCHADQGVQKSRGKGAYVTAERVQSGPSGGRVWEQISRRPSDALGFPWGHLILRLCHL